jgi:hypothetical protein
MILNATVSTNTTSSKLVSVANDSSANKTELSKPEKPEPKTGKAAIAAPKSLANLIKKNASDKGVINPPAPAKNATVDSPAKAEPIKLQVTEDIEKPKKHSHHKKHHHHKMSKKESTEIQILNDRDALFNDEI